MFLAIVGQVEDLRVMNFAAPIIIMVTRFSVARPMQKAPFPTVLLTCQFQLRWQGNYCQRPSLGSLGEGEEGEESGVMVD